MPSKYKNSNFQPFSLSEILEDNCDLSEYRVPDKTLMKRIGVLDICYSNSVRSCCFTKAYGRYMEGTGSIYSENSEADVKAVFDKLALLDPDSEEYFNLLKVLNFRFFTPKEICRLMGFPEYFNFPLGITKKQKYMLLGNSVNVKVVAELIKILADYFAYNF